jgi:predicted NUDIX family NTP pyrophosphohydrolase
LFNNKKWSFPKNQKIKDEDIVIAHKIETASEIGIKLGEAI